MKWYRTNKRELPWREDRDPYHVWVSEVMLQQTRIETVIPYYERFLRELPDIASLSSADDDKLYKLWEGLGYYSRARHLKEAALLVMKEYDGVFPPSYEDILSLPGIGPYIAGAVASIAFEEKTPAIDGNVLRVFSRILKEERTVNDTSYKKELHAALKEIYPEEAGDFTSALMEIGERVCLPNTAPHCGQCPLRDNCLSCQDDTQTGYPKTPLKKKAKEEDRTVFLLIHDDRIAVRKRDTKGLLHGLYEFPNISGHYQEKEIMKMYPGAEISYKGSYTHQFSHLHWKNDVWMIRVEKEAEEYEWVSLKYLHERISLPEAFRKALQYLQKGVE